MTVRIRLILLVVVLAYCAAFGAGQSLGGLKKRPHVQRRVPARPSRARRGSGAARTLAADSVGESVVRFARRLLGTPYRWGGDSPSTGFDCSGLVRFVYAHFGVRLPHSSYADFDLGKRVARGALEPGDLVFFDGVGHVGMYIGGGRFIHAPHTGTDVQISSLANSWFAENYDGARRLLVDPARRLIARVRQAPIPRITGPGAKDSWYAALVEGGVRLQPLSLLRPRP